MHGVEQRTSIECSPTQSPAFLIRVMNSKDLYYKFAKERDKERKRLYSEIQKMIDEYPPYTSWELGQRTFTSFKIHILTKFKRFIKGKKL